MTVTETKKKGTGEITLQEGHTFIFAGVPKEKHAAAGVGCIIQNKLTKGISKWEAHSERLLTIEMQIDNKITTIIAAYGPNEDDKAEEKDKFWEQMNIITEKAKGIIYVAGDLNARVGREERDNRAIGKHGEGKRNNNGARLTEFCLLNNLRVANTYYQHKDIHKYTRQGKNNTEKSIIDYILVERDNRRVRDVRAMRGPEIYSDHFMVVAKVKSENENNTNADKHKTQRREHVTIRSYKLRDETTANKFREIVKNKLENQDTTNKGTEEIWKIFKENILEAAEITCGIIKANNQKKQTSWWNEELNQEIKDKKDKWKRYLQHKTENNYKAYKEQRTKVKIIVKEEKEKSWKRFGEKLEENSKDNQKLFYKVLKNLRNKKTTRTSAIKNKEGNIITENEMVMQRWKEHFQELLCEGHYQNFIDKKIPARNTEQKEQENYTCFTEKDIEEAIRLIRNGKATGHDKISAEMLKCMGEVGNRKLLEVCNKAWEEGTIPEDWQIGVIVPIHKKGDTKDCSNYRGITLLSSALKIYERLLEEKLRIHIEPTMDEAQSGFRKGRSVHDHIFTIKQIIEKAHLSKTSACIAFIDLEKAFDRVRRREIWNILEKRKTDTNLIRAIKSVYSKNTNYVIKDNNRSEIFETREGLRQGGILSPTLFNLYMDDIIKESNTKTKGLNVGMRRMQNINIKVCAFADDLAIIAQSQSELQKDLNNWREILEKRGMKISIPKSKVMMIDKEQQTIDIKLKNEKLQQVTHFKYLGTTIDIYGNQEKDIHDRIDKAAKTYHMLRTSFINKREITTRTKMTVYKTIFRPILTYGSETWVLNKKLESKVQSIEMKYLRTVKGITRLDRVRNVDVRNELQVKPILEHVEQRQLSWWGHLLRTEESRLARKVWEARTTIKRGRGRPKITWDNVIAKNIQKRGRTIHEARGLAQRRRDWKTFVMANNEN